MFVHVFCVLFDATFSKWKPLLQLFFFHYTSDRVLLGYLKWYKYHANYGVLQGVAYKASSV
jgi:hypothetical protein